jgi:1,4-dihydroxy-2-naphthoyl-CoA synthase
MTKRIPDSRLVNMAAEIASLEDLTIQMIDETRKDFPEASHMLTEVLGYLVAAHIGLKDVTEWPVPLP